ncbi:hypothetical protein B0H10DRAFT_2043842 [Mycena sp. CBHHK59/15]|nr:hypothetical protein B0H10DRAFT_2043842 [Mycena sp. CBHHK59/15]
MYTRRTREGPRNRTINARLPTCREGRLSALRATRRWTTRRRLRGDTAQMRGRADGMLDDGVGCGWTRRTTLYTMRNVRGAGVARAVTRDGEGPESRGTSARHSRPHARYPPPAPCAVPSTQEMAAAGMGGADRTDGRERHIHRAGAIGADTTRGR